MFELIRLIGDIKEERVIAEEVSSSAAAEVYHRDYMRTRNKSYRVKNSNRNPEHRKQHKE